MDSSLRSSKNSLKSSSCIWHIFVLSILMHKSVYMVGHAVMFSMGSCCEQGKNFCLSGKVSCLKFQYDGNQRTWWHPLLGFFSKHPLYHNIDNEVDISSRLLVLHRKIQWRNWTHGVGTFFDMIQKRDMTHKEDLVKIPFTSARS